MIRRNRPLLGTFVEIMAPDGHEAAIAAAFAAIAHVHRHMSFHEETSDLALMRRAPIGTRVRVDAATVCVLKAAAELHQRSAGLFDVSVGARLVTTGFLPRPPLVDLRRMRGSASDIEIIDENEVRLHKAMLIDLGGIAKGYAVDCAIAVLRDHGVGQGIVNAGGDLRVIGTEVVHLRGADGLLEDGLSISNEAMASSSNRHMRRRHRDRISTPHRNRSEAIVSDHAVTVIADTCMVADAMTKIALAERELALTLLAEFGGALLDRNVMVKAA